MSEATAAVSTGIEGLDAVLHGGLPGDRVHLVQGATGTGKTTLGLQFALEGARAGEPTLYATLAETEEEIRGIAASHGWSFDGVQVLHQEPVGVHGGKVQTVLHPAEIELPATVDALLERVEAIRPRRLVLDSLSELRILAREPRWYRHELARLRARLQQLSCTVLLLDTGEARTAGESLLGGVLRLERTTPAYGPDRRRLHVVKMRGHGYETGWHDVRIRRGGLAVYPRLVAADHRRTVTPRVASTGLPEFDRMLGGGFDVGAAVLLLGPTGTGKSTLALQCAVAAAERGQRVLAYVFDERIQTVLQRSRGIGIDLERHLESGHIVLRQVDPAELTPGEFAEEVRRRAAEGDTSLVLIDSLNAYVYSMPDEHLLHVHLHELLSYLAQQDVTSILVGTQHGLGTQITMPAGLDVSYLSDTVILLRTLESGGRMRKALAVYKRRAGQHERSVRELTLEPGRIRIGDVLPVMGLSLDPALTVRDSGLVASELQVDK